MQELTDKQYKIILEEIQIKLQEMPTLAMMVIYVLGAIRTLAIALLEEELKRRALQPELWPNCPHCGRKLHSKGFRTRQILTILGIIKWERRIGRCPNGCRDSQVALLDKRLDIKENQRVSNELKRLGSMLCIFVPFNTAIVLLQQLTGIRLSADSLWNWSIALGQRIGKQIEMELKAMTKGKLPMPESLAENLQDAALAIGADGVMVPIRPQVGTPKGKTIWREVKIGILTRLVKRLTGKGEEIIQLVQRRVVAIMGSVDEFMPIIQLEASRQNIQEAKKIVWLSDGGKGFWRIFESLKILTDKIIGVLDFYHAAQHLCNAAKAWLDSQDNKFWDWFCNMRHKLRHGQEKEVIVELDNLRSSTELSEEAKKIIHNVYQYLKGHEDNINYQDIKSQNLPIGSGLVESTCKWLVQQRFKGVGMRWSEEGIKALLQIRVAWVNQRFDDFFPLMEPSPT